MRPTYLRAKVHPPVLNDGSVARPRLSERLNQDRSRVCLVSAPAGYGKTTIVLQALAETKSMVAWLSLDRVDNDPVRFWAHLGASVMRETASLNEFLDSLEPDRSDDALDTVIAYIEQLPSEMTIVLDDLHTVTNAEVHERLSRLVTSLPTNLRLVLVTRSDPPLPIGRLRASGMLCEVRSADLAFTLDEASMLFGDRYASSEIGAVLDRTEGWATALRLLAVTSDDRRGFDDILRDAEIGTSGLGDFLAGEALRSLSLDLQRFLVETSILETLNPEVCDAITGRDGSLARLRELTRGQVFTELIDPVTNTYRYHGMFRTFLRERAEELNRYRLRSLHTAAAAWFGDRNEPRLTIEHALAAGDDPLALATIKKNYYSFGQAGLLDSVNEWLVAYGEDRCRRDPELRLAAAWAALNARRYVDVDYWLDDPTGENADPVSKVQEHTIRSHRARHLGDLQEALAQAQQAIRAIDYSGQRIKDRSIAYSALGLAELLAGRTEQEVFVAAIETGHEVGNDSSVAIGHSGLAFLAIESGALSEADEHADAALAFSSNRVLERFHQPSLALLVKARVALENGLPAEAAQHIDRSESIAERAEEPLVLVLIHCTQALVSHQQGRGAQARSQLRLAEATAGVDPHPYLAKTIRRTRNAIRFVAANTPRYLPELTEKELAVLRLLPHGLARRELGDQLFVSENTIKTHLTSLRHKLGVTGRADQIVDRAKRIGLLD